MEAIQTGDRVTYFDEVYKELIEDEIIRRDFEIGDYQNIKILRIKRPIEFKSMIQIGDIDLSPGDCVEYLNHTIFTDDREHYRIYKDDEGFYESIKDRIKDIKRPIKFQTIECDKIHITTEEKNFIKRYLNNMRSINIEQLYDAITFKNTGKNIITITLKDNSQVDLFSEDGMFSTLKEGVTYYKEEFELGEETL